MFLYGWPSTWAVATTTSGDGGVASFRGAALVACWLAMRSRSFGPVVDSNSAPSKGSMPAHDTRLVADCKNLQGWADIVASVPAFALVVARNVLA